MVIPHRPGRLLVGLIASGLVACAALPARAQPAAPAVTPPSVVTHVDAVYPPSALADRKHGDVVLAVTVDADGHVSRVTVLESGGADLDEAATVAARQWTFVPAMKGGKAVASRIRVPFHFAPPAPPPELVAPPAPKEAELPSRPAVPQAPAPASAPPPPPAPTPAAVEAGAPEEVNVHGRSAVPSVGASDFNLHVGELARVPHQNASDLLKLAPGILLTNEGGEGHAEQVFLRGFDAREGQDLEFTVGGVPINESGNLHGNGYADTHFIIPELVHRLRVVEGPFDPRQGNYAVAGSADYELGLDKRGLTAKYTAGSFNTQRMLVMWGPPGESEHTFAAAEAYSTSGFGQNRDARRGSAYAQYEGALGTGSYRVTGQVYTTDYHSAGVLREDDVASGAKGFYDTYDPAQGGDSFRASVAADLEKKTGSTTLGQQLFVIKRTMRLREDFTGYLLDVQQPWQTPHGQRGDLLDLDVDELTVGARGFSRLSGKALGQTQQLELGYFARYDQVGGSQQRLSPTTLDAYHTDTSLQSNLGDVGLYGAADLKATDWLALRGGVRADVFAYDVNNLCAYQTIDTPSKTSPPLDASCMSQVDTGKYVDPNKRADTASTAVLPKAALLLGPFANVTFSLSYGQGVRSIDPIYITQDVATPFAGIQAYEGGASYAGPVGPVTLVARSVFFDTHVDRDYIFDQTVGRNVIGVGTSRVGWVGAVRATGDWFDESANVTFVKSTYDDTHLLVPYVPDVVVRSDTAVFHDLPWRAGGSPLVGALAAGVTYVGQRPLPFGALSSTIFTIDANASVAWTHYEVGLMVTNLLDARYPLSEFNYVSSFNASGPGAPSGPPSYVPGRLFTAGAPRGVFANFTVNFGGA